jgi:small subunit ribosomal protein S20
VANIKSQIKRNRQNEKRRLRNKSVRSQVKTQAQKVDAALAEGRTDEATERLRETTRMLDAAASKGVIHRNTAARRKSKLARRVAGAGSGS